MINVINPVAVSASPLAMDGRRTRHLKQNKPRLHPIRWLVVDDDPTILKYVAHMLAILGFHKSETAQYLPEVTKKLITGTYEFLIADLEMSDMNGYGLAQKINKTP